MGQEVLLTGAFSTYTSVLNFTLFTQHRSLEPLSVPWHCCAQTIASVALRAERPSPTAATDLGQLDIDIANAGLDGVLRLIAVSITQASLVMHTQRALAALPPQLALPHASTR